MKSSCLFLDVMVPVSVVLFIVGSRLPSTLGLSSSNVIFFMNIGFVL